MATNDRSIVSCEGCGTIMTRSFRNVCPNCVQQEEENFERVKFYVRDHPQCTVADIVHDLEIPPEQINELLESGRLEKTGTVFDHQCKTCGKLIKSGLICGDCSHELQAKLQGLQESISKQKQAQVLWKAKKEK